ncbi:hypothetical protein JHK82_024572 [Glycine max]|nr:hypothetical protein JHK85_025174 [Glycine max]KAG5133384.1 hypothetical protein JHK82_024572 [Glycine max]
MSKVEGSKYEELRMWRIVENQAKIEALWLSKLATIVKDKIQKAKKKDKKKANDDDEDYVPEYEGGLRSNSSSENYENDKHDEFAITNDLESRKRKGRPKYVSLEDWNWLIKNKWSGSKFQEALENVGDIYQEEISKALVLLVEHFTVVLGRKSNHSFGVGSAPITKKFPHKQIIQNQLENAQNQANNLELEMQKLTNITKKQEDVITQLHIEVQSQRELIETNREQMKQNLENEVKCQIVDILE